MISLVTFLYTKDKGAVQNPVSAALSCLDDIIDTAAKSQNLSCFGFILSQSDLGRVSLQEAKWEILYHAGIFDMYRQGEVSWNTHIPDTEYYLENGYF